jgi:hypothetical protein
VLVKATSQEIVLVNNIKKITIQSIGDARIQRKLKKAPIVNDNLSNIHKAVNIFTLSDKDIKKYSLVKIGELFKKDDYILLYDDQYVKIGDSDHLLKMKITKENSVYRKKQV